MVPGGFFQVVSKFFGKEAPMHVLEWIRTMGGAARVVSIPLSTLGVRLVVVADPLLARRILEDPLSTKGKLGYRFIDRMVGGDNFFTTEGPRYKHVRKSTSTAFAKHNVRRMIQIIDELLQEWIQQVIEPKCSVENNNDSNNNQQQQRQPLDVAGEMQRLTMRVIAAAAFDYTATEEEGRDLLRCFQMAQKEYLLNVCRNPLRMIPIIQRLFPGVHEAQQAKDTLQTIARRILQHHRSQTNPNPNTLLSMLEQDAAYESDDEKIRDMLVYLAAGYDTSSYTIAWALLDLAQHPHEQKWLQEALLTKCATAAERRNCPALQHVVKESMRLHIAPALGSSRVLAKDVSVNEEMYIPAGTVVLMPFYVIHRDEATFDQADSFVPRRWESPTEAMSKAWMGFAAGRRNCQGMALAQAEATGVLAELCSKYWFDVVEEGHAEYYVTLKTVGTLLSVKKVG